MRAFRGNCNDSNMCDDTAVTDVECLQLRTSLSDDLQCLVGNTRAKIEVDVWHLIGFYIVGEDIDDMRVSQLISICIITQSIREVQRSSILLDNLLFLRRTGFPACIAVIIG